MTTTSPAPGETCTFHPDCCGPDDRTCPGCGAPAVGAVTYRARGARVDGRAPYCAAHERPTRAALTTAYATGAVR